MKAAKRYKLQVISTRDVMYNTINVIHSILFMKIVKRIIPKSSYLSQGKIFLFYYSVSISAV